MNKEAAIIRRRFNSKPSGVSNSCSFYGNTYELAGIKCKKMWLPSHFYLTWSVATRCQIVALKLISTVIFDTLADSRNNGFNLMMNDGKQQSTFLFHDYAQHPWEPPWTSVSWFVILVWYAIWYTTQFSLQWVVIKLTITSIVDDVCYNHKHHIWTSSVFMSGYLFTPPFLQILKMRFWGFGISFILSSLSIMQTSNEPSPCDSEASATISAEKWCNGGRTGLMKR